MFGNLVENRICYKGDGGGGGGNDGPQTNPGSRERGRGDSIGSIGVVDRTNPAEMRQREQDYVVIGSTPQMKNLLKWHAALPSERRRS